MPNYPYSFQLPPLNVQDIPNDGVAGEFLGISAGGVLDWLPVSASGSGDMLKSENLSGLANYTTARTNIGLGTTDSPTFANLTLTSPSLASSAPVTISQTWGTTGIYTAAKVNVTETATANSASRLLDLQVGGASLANFSKAGHLIFPSSSTVTPSGPGVGQWVGTLALFGTGGSLLVTGSGGALNISGNILLSWNNDTVLLRDGAANTLALRNGETNQKFHVYATYSNASNYRRCVLGSFDGANFDIQTEGLGTGAAGGALNFGTAGARRMTITTAGNVGIGTTAPSEKLHVLGGKVLFGDATDVTGTAGNGDLTLRAWRAPQLNMVANTSSSEVFGLNLKNGATTLAGITLNIGSGEVKIGGFWTGGYFPTFYSNNVERMRIDTGGNVGIGTTSPTSKLHVAETWNAVGTTFTAVNVDVTDTASAAASKLLDLKVGGLSKFNIERTGNINVDPTNVAAYLTFKVGANSAFEFAGGSGYGTQPLTILAPAGLRINQGTVQFTVDTFLQRDGEADHLAMRRGALGQKFSVYGTYSNATTWERFTITAPTSGNVLLGTYKGTGGIARGLEFQTDGVTRMTLSATGSVKITGTFNTLSLNIGETGTNSGFGDFSANAIAVWANGSIGALIGRGGGYSGMRIGSDGMYRFSDTVTPSSGVSAALALNTAGVVEVNNGTAAAFRDLRVRSVIEQPPASITPALNGDLVVEATSNTTLTFKLKGTDGTVRSGTITLA